MDDVILLALTDSLPRPVECVLSPPDQGSHQEVLEAKLLLEFTPESRFDRLAGVQPGLPE